jgi:hypothetical protein
MKGDGGSPLFDRKGAMTTYVGLPTEASPHAIATALVEHGYGWFAPLVHSDGTIRKGLPGWIAALKTELAGTGIKVGGWGADHNAPTPEIAAARALDAVAIHGLDFYIANIEKRGEREPDFSKRWLDVFLPHRAGRPLGLSTEPRLDLPHQLWIDAGADLLPQAYYGENQATPAYCVYHNVAYGWRASRIACSINVGYGDDPGLPGAQQVSVERWRELLGQAQRMGSKGASIWGYLDPGADYWKALP